MIPIRVQAACVERELERRRRVYPDLVKSARMAKRTAAREIAEMEAVLTTLRGLEISPAPRAAGIVIPERQKEPQS